MRSAEWDQILELFHAAREKAGSERVALLDEACGEATPLRKAVEELLKEDEAADGFLSRPAFECITGEPLGSPIASGELFGHYAIGNLLGQGGMGEVWSARDTDLDRPVALKFLSSKALAVLDTNLIVREAKAASALNHPNIVTIHSVVQCGSTLAIVMELIEGVPLRQLIGKPLPIGEVLDIGVQITRALAAAHGGNIIHGDIKPENIVLRRDGYVKVLDFGLARRLDTGATAPAANLGLGTLRYMSPEQARGESLTAASDIFSFGLVLYELATGRHAFPASSPVAAARAILTDEPRPPSSGTPSVPARLDSLIRAMLAKGPAQRPGAEQVAHALDQIKTAQEISSRSPHSKRISKAIGIAASVLLCAALTWTVFFQSKKSVPPAELRPAPQRRGVPSPFPELTINPLTAQPGWENDPAVSPDGKSVAFTWTNDLQRRRAIYVKRSDSDAPILLARSPRNETVGPLAWSPDGSKLAFKASLDHAGRIWIAPLNGGPAVKVTDLINGNPSSSIDWSPDGRHILFSDSWPDSLHLAIFSLDLATGQRQRLTSPPSADWGDWDPKYSPDGTQIAFKRVSGFWRDSVYVMPASGGSVRAVSNRSKGIWGHAWSSQGDALWVSTQGSGTVFGLWRFPVEPGAKPQRITEGGMDAITPAGSRQTSRMAWVEQVEDSNIYRLPLTGNTVPQKLIASTRHDQSGSYAPDGRIAFASDRSGSWEIWIASPTGSRQVKATDLSGPILGCPRWSPDNRYIAFERFASGHNRIVVMSCATGTSTCEQPVALTTARESDPFSEDRPAWSADGSALYFSSSRTGTSEIWKQSWPPSGAAQQVTRHGGFSPAESPDGKWLYYAKADPSAIWRAPLSGAHGENRSSEQIVLGSMKDLLPWGWTLTSDQLLFILRRPDGRSSVIQSHRLRTGQSRDVPPNLSFQLPGLINELSISANGRSLLFWQVDRSGSNVMVADAPAR